MLIFVPMLAQLIWHGLVIYPEYVHYFKENVFLYACPHLSLWKTITTLLVLLCNETLHRGRIQTNTNVKTYT